MGKVVGIIFLNLLLLCTVSQTVQSVVSPSPLLTELHPAPATGQPEWVELYNPDTEPIDLAGWQLWDELSSPSLLLTLNANLAPQEVRVFELPSAKLNNTADGMQLRNPSGEVIDTYSYTSSETGSSWLRIGSNWQLGTPTPGLFQTSEPSPSPTVQPSPSPSPTPPPTLSPKPSPASMSPSPGPTPMLSPLTLRITEIFPCPPTGQQEYITVLNTGTHVLDLGQLLIRDEQHNTRTSSGTLPAGENATITWSSAMLNNSGDTVSLVGQTGQVLDTAQYTDCQTGQPLTLTDGNWNSESTATTQPTPSPTPSPSPTASTTPSPANLTATPSATIAITSKLPNRPPPLLPNSTLTSKPIAKTQDLAHTLTYVEREVSLLAVTSAILGGVLLLLGGATLTTAKQQH